MDAHSIIFYVLSLVIIVAAAAVITLPNPIYAALSLAATMVGLGFMYFLLEAYFIAGVQLIVYAGAVMVLFVMVLMLFDLQKEKEAFSGSVASALIKLLCGTTLMSFIALAIRRSVVAISAKGPEPTPLEQIQSIKMLAGQLFTRYVFAFEALGVLLLVIAIGVVAVSRAKGGTHANDV